MTAIRSLADELREKMRQEASGEQQEDKPAEQEVKKPEKERNDTKGKAGKPPPENSFASLEILFTRLSAFELTGNEKLLIRLDNRTVFLLKQLKIAKSIDMNKLIAYSVDIFFKERPELIEFIKSTLQTIDL
jgi:hypothetical protein